MVEEEEDGTSADQLRLLCSPVLSTTSPVHNAAVLRQPEVLVPLMLIGDSLGPKESLRVSGLSFIPILRLPTSETSLVQTLGSLLAGLQPSSAHNIVTKSELRRPSVDAVTSAATSSSAPLTVSSEPFSLSDSCADNNNNSDSELSYNVSEGGVSRSDRKQRATKKKETFSERLKAALARGNTPDESDDASAAAPVPLALRRVKVPMNQRAVRRQGSSGFPGCEMTETESDDFWTATEDEHSIMEKSLRLQPRPLMALKGGGKGIKVSSSAAASPLVRSPLLLSSSSIGPPTPPTSSSCLYSDSDSFSSEGLGMPKMEDEALEDLAEQLHGCLEGSDGTLHFRGLEVARVAEGRLVRSFSDSFLAAGGDLDRLGSLASGVQVSEARESLRRANSAIGLAGEDWGPALGKDPPKERWEGVRLEAMGSEEEAQGLAILAWAAATLADLPKATFNTQGSPLLARLSEVAHKVEKSKCRVGQLLSLLLQYQDITLKEPTYQDGHMYQDVKNRNDLITFVCNKL